MKSDLSENLRLSAKKLDSNPSLYRIVRDDLQEDSITKLHFSCYDDAYDELERFYADLCCSDERIEYSIVLIWFFLLVEVPLGCWFYGPDSYCLALTQPVVFLVKWVYKSSFMFFYGSYLIFLLRYWMRYFEFCHFICFVVYPHVSGFVRHAIFW